jgi:hypothetical protein
MAIFNSYVSLPEGIHFGSSLLFELSSIFAAIWDISGHRAGKKHIQAPIEEPVLRGCAKWMDLHQRNSYLQ